MNRIANHPILGEPEARRRVTFSFNGKAMEGYEGEPIAMALKAAGVVIHRYTAKRHEPRGIFCAIGRCTDCVMVVDGVPNIRTCVTPLAEGMDFNPSPYIIGNHKLYQLVEDADTEEWALHISEIE